MNCFSYIESRILSGIENIYESTLTDNVINKASIRLHACEANSLLFAEYAKRRDKNLFLYGYTELIPESSPGTLFPEGSFLLDLPTKEYYEHPDDGCIRIQTCENRTLLGCLPDAKVVVENGYIVQEEGKLKIISEKVVTDELVPQANIIVLEA